MTTCHRPDNLLIKRTLFKFALLNYHQLFYFMFILGIYFDNERGRVFSIIELQIIPELCYLIHVLFFLI